MTRREIYYNTRQIDAVVNRLSNEELVYIALEKYQHGNVGMRGAADIAGLTIAEMMVEANERGILQNYNETELKSDVESLL